MVLSLNVEHQLCLEVTLTCFALTIIQRFYLKIENANNKLKRILKEFKTK